MKLTIFNGSPHGKTRNTEVVLESFCKGFLETEGNSIETHYLAVQSKMDKYVKAYEQAEVVIIAFPLYVHAMPAIVKTFIEKIPIDGKKRKIGFIVQQGFPESGQSRFLVPYLKRLPEIINAEFLGTAIRPGIEGISIMPEFMVEKKLAPIYELGQSFGKSGKFEKKVLETVSRPFRLPLLFFPIWLLMKLVGFANMYWNQWLKRNKAHQKRFDKPYGE